MIFNSVEFVYFFAVFFVVYFNLPDRWKNAFLLAASYFFYGFWSVKYLCLLVFTMALDYGIALLIDGTEDERKRKFYLTASIIANLGILFIFKYFNLFSDLLATVTGKSAWRLNLILPFGISFYTFHAMSYTIDVYRRTIKAERDFTLYSGYVMFFPQLVAGPIARASHLLHQFAEPKRFRVENIIDGSYLIAKGYFMKVVLADALGGFVDTYFNGLAAATPMLRVQSVYFFAFQIYCDFAGYTLIARGIARWLDFDLVDNFRMPYFSTSITDFWRRWHISLSTWLRDYLYISLGGNRQGKWMTYRNLMLTMLLGGLWHGSNWTFVIWGGLHGLYLAIEKAMKPSGLGQAIHRSPVWLRRVVVFHLVLLAWIFFRADTFGQAWEFMRAFGDVVMNPAALNLNEISIKLWSMSFFLLAFEALELHLDLHARYREASWPVRFAAMYTAICAVALCAELNPKAFIYFQF